MAYTPKAGQMSLFKNDRKEKDSHPDYKGDGMDLEGNPVWISAWVKEGAKGKFFSISIQPKQQKAAQDDSAYNPPASKNLPRKPAPDFSDLDSEIPF
jgi:hypothetical protein